MSVLEKGLRLSVATGIAAAFTYGYRILSARTLSVDDYGLLSLLLAVFNIILLIFLSSVPPSIAKFVSAGEDAGNIYKTALKRFPLIGIFIAVLLVALSGKIAGFYDLGPSFWYFFLIALAIPPTMVLAVDRGWVQGVRNMGAFGYSQIVQEGSKFFMAAILIFAGFGLFGAVFAILFGTLVAAYYTRRFVKAKGVSNPKSWKKLADYFVPVSLTRIIDGFIMNVDTLFLKIWFPLAVVGTYNAAAPIARIPLLAFGALSTVILPEVSANNHDADKVLKSSLKFVLLFVLPGVLLVSLFPEFFISLFFGSKYTGSAAALQILVFSSLFLGLYKVFSSVLQGVGRQYAAAGIFVFVLALDIALNIALVPSMGMLGAAYANLASGIAAAVLSFAAVKKAL